LGVVLRVSSRTPISHPDVKIAIGTEVQLASIVIIKGLIDFQKHSLGGVSHVRIRSGRPILRNDRLEIWPAGSVVHKKAAIVLVIRMKGDAQEATFATGGHERTNVQERSIQHCTVLEDANSAFLLDDEEPVGTVSGVRDKDGQAQTGDDGFQGQCQSRLSSGWPQKSRAQAD
jgi:hypothetical protein